MEYQSKKYWLLKSEAEMYSIDDFKKDAKTIWTEVRNYQARNHMRDLISVGDYFFFYHSSSEPTGIAGVGKVSKIGIGDPTALDKKSEYYDPKATKENNPWITIEVQFLKKFKNILTLAEIKANKNLSKMVLNQKGSRLSVQPVTESEFKLILTMCV